jgi:2-polyprenyl-3-methyl-5-hydroxy-6-metoxy-1,4-benzoquinol methylase
MPSSGRSGREECLACRSRDVVTLQGWQARLGLASSDVLRRCRRCGLGWLDRAGGAADYSSEYFDSYARHGEMPGGIDGVPPHIHARLIAIEARLGRTGQLLDVGCGYGNVLQAARERGWMPLGVDVSPWSAEYVRKTRNLPVIVGDVADLQMTPGAFDVVHASHAFEHMVDPRRALQKVRAWIKRDGLLIVEVPNQLDELYALLRWRLLRRFVPPPVANSHLFFFTTESLRRLLAEAGYDVISVSTERRNIDRHSRVPLGGLVKRALFAAEHWLARGPNVVAWARPTSSPGAARTTPP